MKSRRGSKLRNGSREKTKDDERGGKRKIYSISMLWNVPHNAEAHSLCFRALILLAFVGACLCLVLIYLSLEQS